MNYIYKHIYKTGTFILNVATSEFCECVGCVKTSDPMCQVGFMNLFQPTDVFRLYLLYPG